MTPPYLLRLAAALTLMAGAPERGNFGRAVLPPTPTTTETLPPSFTVKAPTVAPTHTIAVGADGFTYTPQEYGNADIGDIIEFQFYPGGHTVVRAEFGFPCIPYEYTGVGKIGFYSGLKSPQVISNNLPTYQIRVNTTDPIFFYCSAPGSCYRHHMIGVINPNANETLERQLEFAKNATYQLAPGDPWPSETVSSGVTPGQTAGPVGGGGGSNTGPNNSGGGSDNGGHHHHVSPGAIAGIVIGAAAVLVLGAGLVYLCGSRRLMGQMQRREGLIIPRPMTQYSVPQTNDTFRAQSPSHSYMQSQSPVNGGPGYSGIQGPVMAGGTQGYYYPCQQLPTPTVQAEQHQEPAPIELPASDSPANSPPSDSLERKYSWSGGEEALYRPGDKSRGG